MNKIAFTVGLAIICELCFFWMTFRTLKYVTLRYFTSCERESKLVTVPSVAV